MLHKCFRPLTIHLVLLLIKLIAGDGRLAMIEAVAATVHWLLVRGDLARHSNMAQR